MSRKQCRPPDPHPTSRPLHASGLSLIFWPPSTPRCRSHSLSTCLSLFPASITSFLDRIQRHELLDPRRDCEIEKRCRRTRRADSRPHHGPTPPPTKSPSQGRFPLHLTSYESGRPSSKETLLSFASPSSDSLPSFTLSRAPVPSIPLLLSFHLCPHLSLSLGPSVHQVFLHSGSCPSRDYRFSLYRVPCLSCDFFPQ